MQAVFILDWCHASEYVWDCGKTLYAERKKLTEKWVHKRWLWIGDGWKKKLLDDLKQKSTK